MGKSGRGIYPCCLNELSDEVTKISLVLGLMVKLLAAHLCDVGLGVPPRPQKLPELLLLHLIQRQILGTKLDYDFLLRGM